MFRLLTILFLIGVWAQPSWAGAGHDHGAGPGGEGSSSIEVPRLESVGTELELVAVVIDGELVIYLDESATNAPVDDATIEVSGDDIPAAVAKPAKNGTYSLDAEWVSDTGTKALTFVVTASDRIELLNGTLDLGTAQDHSTAHSSSLLARPMFWLLASVAAILGFLLAFAFRPVAPPRERMEDESAARPRPKLDVVSSKKHAANLIALVVALAMILPAVAMAGSGHDHGPGGHDEPASAGGYIPRKLPDGEVFLPKPSQRLLNVRTTVAKATNTQTGEELIGTVIADPASEGRVQAPMDGEVELASAGVAFVGERVKAGDVLAYLAPSMPVYERGYLEQLTAEVDGKLRIAEQRLKRLQGVRENFVAQKDIDDTSAELSALREQQRVLEPKSGQRIALKAPVDGIISVANVRAGQVVNARDTLFEIVDPERLWIEAIGISGRAYDDIAAAHAVLGQGQSFSIKHVGSAPALRHQARPLFFNVTEPDAALAIGTKVRVVVQTGAPVNGIVLPETAVVRGTNGLEQIWVKIGAEQFQPKAVKTEPLGGTEVLVTAGLETGNRVVVSGSEFVNQVR
jgi:cobalt-zinc-cadmium efflux system membrane fusion protein